ncbi:hypothetical protein [Fructobacillus durionis]|uniref:DUF4325 domain-containing protein n=1 Tax=Fructobacillus durionis TaxID=283737 RepID=A0A1I1H3F7_9LACO|nr:hypothetical protein [Fructobacillus durionis]SFC15983.1 hypothetical protein SAMN05660453_1213 [Fructobacillus durionis]
MNTTINLDFGSKEKWALAGDHFGKQVYQEQVANVLTDEEWQNEITICFPDQITLISISFWDGFAQPMVNKIGYDGITERVHFVTSSKKLTKELYNDLI